jgi:DtxR family transcriptional regulator, Mn-dependent transcriptional regulator
MEAEMSSSTQEYLEALYTLTQNGKKAGTTELSKKLGISAASVTEMLKKLSEMGYINYSRYQGVTLSPEGFKIAEKMARKHRILERFLHDVLRIGTDKVHEEACEMEHSLSDNAERAMCQNLNSPDKCPDDQKLIPACNLGFSTCAECQEWKGDLDKIGPRKENIISLAELKEKQEGLIAFIRGDKKALQRLKEMGLTPGTNIKVSRIAPLKGPVEIVVRGSRLALGDQIACNVFIKRENP